MLIHGNFVMKDRKFNAVYSHTALQKFCIVLEQTKVGGGYSSCFKHYDVTCTILLFSYVDC